MVAVIRPDRAPVQAQRRRCQGGPRRRSPVAGHRQDEVRARHQHVTHVMLDSVGRGFRRRADLGKRLANAKYRRAQVCLTRSAATAGSNQRGRAAS